MRANIKKFDFKRKHNNMGLIFLKILYNKELIISHRNLSQDISLFITGIY